MILYIITKKILKTTIDLKATSEFRQHNSMMNEYLLKIAFKTVLLSYWCF